MRMLHGLVLLGIGAVIACGVSADHGREESSSGPTSMAGAQSGGPPGGGLPTGSPRASSAVAQIQSVLAQNGHATGASTYRVAGDANTPDLSVQLQLALMEAGKLKKPATKRSVDWNVTTNAAVRATPAAYGSSWTAPSSSDLFAFASDTNSSGAYGLSGGTLNGASDATLTTTTSPSSLFVMDTLHPSVGGPRLIYYDAVATNHYGLSGLVFSDDPANLRLYALTSAGVLNCYLTPQNPASPPTAMTVCNGWGGGFAGPSALTWSSPYPDFVQGSGVASGDVQRMYWTDDGGHLVCANTSSLTAGPTACSASYPKSMTGYTMGPPVVREPAAAEVDIFAGDSNGDFYQAQDLGGVLTVNTACLVTGATGACSGASAAQWAVESSPSLDLAHGLVYVAAGGTLQSFPLAFQTTAASWKTQVKVTLPLTSGSWATPIASSATEDLTNGYVYVPAAGSLYKAAVPLVAGSALATALYDAPASSLTVDSQTIAAQSQPLGYPFPYYSSVFTNTSTGGTSASAASGGLEEYGCSGSATQPGLQESSNGGPYGVAIESGMVVDWMSGNLYFGYDNGVNGANTGSGGVVQYPASATVPDPAQGWSCPTSRYSGYADPICGEAAPGCSLCSWALGAQVAYGTGSLPYSVAVGDFNGDGKPDLAVANNGSTAVGVLLNAGSGTFAAQVTYATGSYPESVAVGDFNGDGKPDLVVANSGSNTVGVLLNAGSGTFATQVTYATGSRPDSVAVGDFNGDGKPDLAVANNASNTVSVLLNAGSGTFAAQVTYATETNPSSVAVGDFNADGRPDLAVTNSSSETISLLLNAGSGTFAAQVTYATELAPESIAVGDFNGDGELDLAVANYSSNTVGVLLNAGSGTFAAQVTYATGSLPLSIAVGDFNGDDKPDLAVANDGSNTVGVLLNAGSGTFAAQVTYAIGGGPVSVAVGDFNGDDAPDLAVANSGSGNVGVVLNEWQCASCAWGKFSTQVTYTTGNSPNGVAVGDFNGDGKPDLAIANTGSNTIGVLLNAGGSFDAQVTYATGGFPVSVAVGDFNGDGKPDLAVANENSNTVGILLNAGAGTFASQVTYTTGTDPTGVAVGDFNGDGKPDLAVANPHSNTISVLLNAGTGTFHAQVLYPTGIDPFSVAVGDFNGDGKPDLAVANLSSSTVGVLLNAGSGTFAAQVTHPTGSNPFSVAVGDFNGDGKPDLAVPNSNSDTISVLLNAGNGTFAAQVTYATGSSPYSVAVGDFNADGKPDLAVINLSSSTVGVLLNAGSGTFAAQVTYAAGNGPAWVAVGDLNGDGKLDLAIPNSSSNNVSVLLGACE